MRRRRLPNALLRVLTAPGIGLRTVMLLIGITLAVLTNPHAREELSGIVIGAGALLAAILFWASQVPRLRRRKEDDELALAEIDDEISQRRRKQVERVILPTARERVNRLRNLPFSDRLTPTDASGLGDLYDPEYEVRVAATEKLGRALASLKAGSIGIAGPRGVGKTTLIRAACEGRLDRDREDDEGRPHGLRVSAPVRYGAEDFVRHLFAQFCLAVLGPGMEREDRQQAQRESARVFQLTVATLAMAVLGVVTIVFYATGVRLEGSTATRAEITVALFSGYFSLVWARELVRRYRPPRESEPIKREARRSLERLRYLETRSAEASGRLSAGPAALGAKRGTSLAAQAWTFPEVIEHYRRFVSQLATRGPVIIGVDELDKMASAEEARSFLNELKSLFDQPGVFYLVSISEEALGEFERRGQPIRDVFDSVFADVLRVDYLREGESEALLRRRALGIPPPWPALFHCMSGGLPRESIRLARRALQIGERHEPDLATVTLALVAERVAAHEHAVTVIAGERVAPDGTQPLLSWLAELPSVWEEGEKGGEAALAAAREAIGRRLGEASVLAALCRLDGSGAEGGLERLVIELAAGWHHSLTCLEFFSGLTAAKFGAARSSRSGQPSPIDLLARGHQELAVAPALSWQTVDAFRRRVGLVLHPYPSSPRAETVGGRT